MLVTRIPIVWFLPHAVVAHECARVSPLDGSCWFCFSAVSIDIYELARSPEHFLEICDVVLRLLAATVVHSVVLGERTYLDSALINAESLAYLMEQCRESEGFKIG
jgi:hypothetical protein